MAWHVDRPKWTTLRSIDAGEGELAGVSVLVAPSPLPSERNENTSHDFLLKMAKDKAEFRTWLAYFFAMLVAARTNFCVFPLWSRKQRRGSTHTSSPVNHCGLIAESWV